jgi:hypothetical protein
VSDMIDSSDYYVNDDGSVTFKVYGEVYTMSYETALAFRDFVTNKVIPARRFYWEKQKSDLQRKIQECDEFLKKETPA